MSPLFVREQIDYVQSLWDHIAANLKRCLSPIGIGKHWRTVWQRIMRTEIRQRMEAFEEELGGVKRMDK